MATYHYQPMTSEYAFLICHWTYEEPYSIYNMDGSKECVSELLNGDYFYALDNEDILVGFICKGKSARVPGGYEVGIYNDNSYLDIGLGLRPDVTGKGNGLEFFSQSIDFINDQLQAQNFQLVVAMFNERAIKVYQRAGFTKGMKFKSKVKEQELDFIVMKFDKSNLA